RRTRSESGHAECAAGSSLLRSLVVHPQLRDGVGRRLTGGLPLAGLQPGQVIVDQCADLLAHQEADHQVTHGAHTEEEVEEIPQHTEGAHRADDGEGAAQEPVGQNELLAAQD
ncbi:Cupin domain-containing protein, partial [Dysosmobacter welbionis]